jgi:transposase
MNKTVIGIDISKSTFDVALLKNEKIKTKKFTNNSNGFAELKKWLTNNEASDIHACMEATGCYGTKLAEYLYVNNFMVSVVNPARIKGFSQSKLCRVKTDKADCQLIAQFCQMIQPDPWKPTDQHIQQLKEWVHRLDILLANKLQEGNRIEGSSPEVVADIQSHIEFIDERIKKIQVLISNHIQQHTDLNENYKLLATIPGIGDKTISVILAFLSNIKDFNSAKQVAAFIGLNPKHRQSGSSLNMTSKISKTGDAKLRKAFYMPALVSIRYNPIINEFSQRLTEAGKPKMVVLIAAMRKLIHIIYGVLKNKTPFNENIMKKVIDA